MDHQSQQTSFFLPHASFDTSQIKVIQKVGNSQSDILNNEQKYTLNILDTNGLMGTQIAVPSTTVNQVTYISDTESDIPNLTSDPGIYGFGVCLEDREDTLKTPTWLVSKTLLSL